MNVTVISDGVCKQIVAVEAPQGELHAQDLHGAPKRRKRKRKKRAKRKLPKIEEGVT